MDNQSIMAVVDAELARLTQIKALLQSKAVTEPKRTMSPEARQRISEAQKRRWEKARQKKGK